MNQTETIIETQPYPILTTKLFLPSLRPELVPRSRLTAKLDAGLKGLLTLVCAPAGFGKTTLISSWIHQNQIPTAWICLDKAERDPVQFFNYLIAAIQCIDPKSCKSIQLLLQSPQMPPVHTILTSLINEINHFPEKFVLVLDDYHLIETPEINKITGFLLEHLPHQMRIILISRSDPAIPYARIRGRNLLTEIRTSDLRFTLDETVIFINKVMNLKLADQDLSLLEARTEGWITGIQLAVLSMQGQKDISEFIKSFSGDDRQIVDYLLEEVLNHQPAPVQNFLLQTSILSRLSESLCNFVTGEENSREMLDFIERTNLFINPMDNKRKWYRYHHLFAEILQQRLLKSRNELINPLHNRASRWYEQNNFSDEAVDHALTAKDFPRVCALIGEQAEDIWKRGEHFKYRRWLEKLPDDLIFSNPRLSILNAETLLVRGQINTAEQSLRMAGQALIPDTGKLNEPPATEKKQLTDTDKRKLQGRISANLALITAQQGDVSGTVQHALQALKYLPEKSLTWRSLAAITLGDAHSINGDMDAAYKAQMETLKICKLADNIFLSLIAHINLAVTLRQQGRLQETIDICKQQLQLANEKGMSQSVVAGWYWAIWGEVLAEFNDMPEALKNAEKGVKLAELYGEVGMLSKSYLCLLRVLHSQGNLKGAEDIFQKLENLGRNTDFPAEIPGIIAAGQAKHWLIQNKLTEISQWLLERGLSVDDEITYLNEPEYIVYTRILMAQNQPDKAILLLKRLLEFTKKNGLTTRQIEILILLALALMAYKDIDEGVEAMEQAVALAKPFGFIRIFIDEGQPVAELLEEILNTGSSKHKNYIKKLLTQFNLSKTIITDDGFEEQLSGREIEVLKLLAAGLSNKKITEKLFISLSTVKTHLRNIYSKLNVNSRTEAIVKAKELELF